MTDIQKDKLKIGDIVICKHFTKFLDGTTHKFEEKIIITKSNINYFKFQYNYVDYDLVEI